MSTFGREVYAVRVKWIGMMLMMLGVSLTLSGCMLTASVEELYALPQLPTEYQTLGQLIDEILAGGAETISPVAGNNLQSVQPQDLDGDGVPEILAFFRCSNEERPLKIYIFRQENEGYELAASIEGSGTSIYSISYSDMNGDGVQEIIVSWRIGTQQALSVYRLEEPAPVPLMSASYVRYDTLDLDGDDMLELVVLRGDENEAGGSLADLYDWDGTSLLLRSSARLSVAVSELQWMQKGNLDSGECAVFVTGRVAGVEETSRAVVDILICREGELHNILLSPVTGVSDQISRYSGLQPTDIDGDGAIEIPVTATLPAADISDQMWKIYWYDYDANGNSKRSVITYHNLTDSWYLMIPEEWDGRFTVIQNNTNAAEHATIFYTLSGRSPDKILFTVYTLTGDNREEQATAGNRMILRRQFSAVYALEPGPKFEKWRYKIELTELIGRFHAITAQWSTGEE